jgi:hypothetical protein
MESEYRERARNALREAEKTRDPGLKQGFLILAQEWQRMADRAQNDASPPGDASGPRKHH